MHLEYNQRLCCPVSVSASTKNTFFALCALSVLWLFGLFLRTSAENYVEDPTTLPSLVTACWSALFALAFFSRIAQSLTRD